MGILEIFDSKKFMVGFLAALAVVIVLGIVAGDVRPIVRKVDDADDSILGDSLSAEFPLQVDAVPIDHKQDGLVLAESEAKKVKKIIAGCI
jgi:hypothetical protein